MTHTRTERPTPSLVSALALAVVLTAPSLAPEADAATRCRALCRPEIAACQADCAALESGRARRRCRVACRRSIVSACRAAAIPVCPAGASPRPADPCPGCGTVPTGFEPAVRLTSSGVERTYARFVPPTYDGRHAYPVVFGFHGDGGSGAGVRPALGLEGPAAGAAIFVYPDATEASGRSFDLETPRDANTDMQLVLDVLDDLSRTYRIDRTRVFATGHSRGGFFANFLNCRLGTMLLRAVAPQAASGPYGPDADYDVDGHFRCEAPAAAAMLIHGTADPVVPIADARYSRWQWTWANRCAATTRPASPAPCVEHDGCAPGTPVAWCEIPGLGHGVWDQAGQAVWAFFARVGGVSAPAAGATMRVVGRELHDAAGERVLLRGVNKMNVFTDRRGDSFPEIRRAGANTVRIVWATDAGDFVPTAADLDLVVGRAIAEGLVPMAELHDATGDLGRLGAMVDWWTRPDVVAVIRKHERWLLLNVANEAGSWEVTAEQFRAAYLDAVARLRAAGIRVPLVIDAPDWGKSLDVVIATHADLQAADPEHNLLFSVHTYWGIQHGADAAFVHAKLGQAAAAGVPLVIGEFSRYGAYAGGASICSAAGEIDYRAVLAAADAHGIGWYAWEWGPGNVGGGDPLCEVMDMTADGTLATLKAGWATDVVERMRATAIVLTALR